MNAFMMEMLVVYEQTISRLYNTFADLYPDHRVFWATLAWEEVCRANRIHELENEIEQRHAAFESANFNAAGIQNSILYIKNQIENLPKRTIPLITALSIARDIERSIIYGKIFESFRGFTAKNRLMIRDLRKGVNDGNQAIESAWNEHRRFV